jgi:hypothetical protein
LIAQNNTPAEDKRIEYEMVLQTQEGLYHAFEETDRILTEVAMQKDVQLIDASSSLTDHNDLLLDTAHLSDRGADVLSEMVVTSLASSLAKRSQTPIPLNARTQRS